MGKSLYEIMKPEIDEAIQKGILKTLFSLVREKLLTLEVAAAKANMSQEEFKKLLAQN